MTPPQNAVRLIGHKRRFAESIAQIDNELEFASGVAVADRRDEVVAAARRLRPQRGLPRGTRRMGRCLSRRHLQLRGAGQGQAAGIGVGTPIDSWHRA